MNSFGPFCVAGISGVLVALAELLSRYPWSVKHVLGCAPGWTYLAINAGAGVGVYWAVRDLGLFQLTDNTSGNWEIWRALMSALFGMAALRSSFINIKTEGKSFSAGLNDILEVFRNRAERALDQNIAIANLCRAEGMHGLSFEACREYLTAVTLETLGSLSATEREEFNSRINGIAGARIDDLTKMHFFALLVYEVAGERYAKKLLTMAKKKYPFPSAEAARDVAEERSRELLELRRQIEQL